MIFSELNKYSFTNENIDLIHLLPLCGKSEKKGVKDFSKSCNEKKKEDLFIPKYKDTLFWCYYILANGIENYEMIRNDFQEEKMMKISLIQSVRLNKDILKKLKIKRTFVEDDLLNQQVISTKTFLLLCELKNINIVIKDNCRYMENNIESSETKIIEKKENKYGLCFSNKDFDRTKYWKVDDFETPLRSLSYYKLKDLQDICIKLNLDIKKDNKNLRKKDLYQNILLNSTF